MFEDLCFYLLIFAISFLFHYLWRLNLGPFLVFLNILGFIGVLVHEISHYIFCVILGVPVERIRVYYRSRSTGIAAPNGYVKPKEPERVSFLQGFVVAIAPLLVSTWLFFLCLDIFAIEGFEPWIYLLAGLMSISLLIGSSPSGPDIGFCYKRLMESPTYSLYQIVILFISILTVVFLINYSWMTFPFEFFHYIAQYITIGVLYFVYKYVFRGMYLLMKKAGKSSTINVNKITRKRHKPMKPHKLGIEEPHW